MHMAKRDRLISALSKKYPLVPPPLLLDAVNQLFAALKTSGHVSYHPEEPPGFAYSYVVKDFFRGLSLTNAALGNARALTQEFREKSAKHDPSRNGYQKKYQKKRYHDRMEEAKKSLGGKCSSCGSTRNLELDHKDPGNKSFNISKLWSVPEAEFKREVKKCRLLCNSCHRKNTGKQREEGEVKSTPGKSEYGKDNRKKAALQRVAVSLMFKDASHAGSVVVKQVKSVFPDIQVLVASSFNKSKSIEQPVLTWNVFAEDGTPPQVLFRLYFHEEDAKTAKSVLDYVKEALKPTGLAFDYEDDLSEPGLMVRVVSANLIT